jgi:hypothetical protein
VDRRPADPPTGSRLAEVSQEHLRGAEQLDWLRRLADDQDNLHAAARDAVAAGDAAGAVRLAAALGWYWILRSMKVEGAELIAAAIGLPGADAADPEQLTVAYTMGGLLTADTPMQETGIEWLRRAGQIAARVPDPANPITQLAGPLGRLFFVPRPEQGPAEPEIFDDAAASQDPWVRAIARILRAHAALNLGRNHAQAEADFLAGKDILAGLGERWGQAVALGGLAMLAGWRGEPAAALAHYRQAIQFAAAFGSTEDEVQFRLFMVRQLWLLGEREAAWAELRRAQPDAERLGLPEVVAFAACTAGDLARLDGQPGAARAALLRTVDLARPQEVAQQIRAVASTGLGYLAGAEGDLEAGRDWHAQALAAAREAADAPVIAEALSGLADLALREGRPERAAQLLDPAAAGPDTMSPRTASEISDTGLALDQACSQPGMDAVETNASLVNVIGNSTTKPKICTFSGLAASIPTRTRAQAMASVDTSTRPAAASTPSGLVPNLKPRMTPITSSMRMAQACLARSATIRPASGANRAMGSERSRSKNPFSRSVASPVAVFSVVNSEFCTMMPGSANSRYACGEPPIAPPNTYVNRSRNITGPGVRSAPRRDRRRRRARRPAGPAWPGCGPRSSSPRRSAPAGRTPSRWAPRG